MSRCLRRLLAVGLCTLLLLGTFQVSADASGVPRVSGVEVVGQSWCAARLKVRWEAVARATYQVRWAHTKAGLSTARPASVSRTRAKAGPLPLTGKSFVQVRAVRGSRVGPWSSIVAGHFTSRWPSEPQLAGSGVTGGVRFRWGCVKYASRYRVRWGAAPYGKWPSTPQYVSGWLAGGARSSAFRVPSTPQSGDHMLAVAYANPVWGRLEAGNLNGGVRLSVGWRPVFPTPPNPGTGDRLRMGTYNVKDAPTGATRIDAIAANIKVHEVSVVSLQEASSATASALVRALGAGWAAASFGVSSAQQIIYRTSAYRVDDTGTFTVPNPKDSSSPLVTPWAHFVPVASASPGHGQSLYVVAAHFAENPNRTAMEKKRDAGLQATAAMRGIDAVDTADDPVIIAGDLRYLREPFNDVPGYVEAPPTLVRGGYYDAMAALRKTNIQFPTFNGGDGISSNRQTATKSGVAARSDYVMLRGFRGSNAYVNVANWSYNGVVPSDHNLVYADLTVPFAP